MESLDGILTRTLYHKPSKFNPSGRPYLIAKLHNSSIVKGEMSRPVEGESYRFWGEWKAQKGRDEDAFEFVSHEAVIERSASGIAMYLGRHIHGLGPIKAAAVVNHFGDDTLDVLRKEPEKLLEVKGITAEIVDDVRRVLNDSYAVDPAAYARLMELFSGHRFPKKLVNKLLDLFGSDADAKVKENPYLLLAFPRTGWKSVDPFAITTAGYDPAGLERQMAAIVEGLERLADEGHTQAEPVEIEAVAFDLLGMRPAQEAWDALVDGGFVDVQHREGPLEPVETFALTSLAAAEMEIARRIADLLAHSRPLPFDLDHPHLNDDQRSALRMMHDHSVCILAGAPGTGKSYSIAKAIDQMADNGMRGIRVVAPTGKAAKRAAELIGALESEFGHAIPCTTIHRALGPCPSSEDEGIPTSAARFGRGREEFGFAHNESNPLDSNVVVVDETSMVDVKLFAALLRAIKPGTRLIIVGDPNQLPSVGPGSVLRDLIEAGLPCVTLDKIVRSDGGGRVVRACHAIKDGRMPEPAARLALPTENWIHLEVEKPEDIADVIVELHAKVRGNPTSRFEPLWGMQVVTPQKSKLAIACDNLNDMLSELLNPRSGPEIRADAENDNGWRPPFRKGDKVVRTKNGLCDEMVMMSVFEAYGRADWHWDSRRWTLRETDVVNGDMGRVEDIVSTDDDVFAVVRFRTPERLCRLPMGECHLIQTYALTCHKAQGSGFPYVIVPVHNTFYWDDKAQRGLWNREWIYTAISRAEDVLVTVGQFSAIRAAVGRKTVHRRKTRLTGLLLEELATSPVITLSEVHSA